jgi:hypothetical protein
MTKLLIRSDIDRTVAQYDAQRVETLPPVAPTRAEPKAQWTGLRGIRPTPPQPPTPREIREHAYYLYLEQGVGESDACNDWLRAERNMWSAYQRNLEAYMRLVHAPSA